MILFVAAMKEEVKLFYNQETENVKVLLTGIGKVNAAMVLADFLAKNQVEAIYNLGFAGATEPYEVGDLVLIKEAMYHDFDLTIFGHEKGQVPGFPALFLSNDSLVKQIESQFQSIKTGRLLTGDYFMTKKQEKSCILDMEGAALYHVAYKNNIPIVSVKIVSDVMGMTDHYQSYKKFEAQIGAELLHNIFKILVKEVSK
jgi:adenosylhomocysteine nucleosidase